MAMAVLTLAALLVTGCATKRVDWDSRLGTYTYDQAIAEYGPPDKVATLSDGQKVADWITSRSSSGVSFGVGMGSFGRHSATGVGVGETVGNSYDHIMRLTFGPDGRLVHWTKN